jgi:hypothetical protein
MFVFDKRSAFNSKTSLDGKNFKKTALLLEQIAT